MKYKGLVEYIPSLLESFRKQIIMNSKQVSLNPDDCFIIELDE